MANVIPLVFFYVFKAPKLHLHSFKYFKIWKGGGRERERERQVAVRGLGDSLEIRFKILKQGGAICGQIITQFGIMVRGRGGEERIKLPPGYKTKGGGQFGDCQSLIWSRRCNDKGR